MVLLRHVERAARRCRGSKIKNVFTTTQKTRMFFTTTQKQKCFLLPLKKQEECFLLPLKNKNVFYYHSPRNGEQD